MMPKCLKKSISIIKVAIIKLLLAFKRIAERVKKIASQRIMIKVMIIRVDSGLVRKKSRVSKVQRTRVKIKVGR